MAEEAKQDTSHGVEGRLKEAVEKHPPFDLMTEDGIHKFSAIRHDLLLEVLALLSVPGPAPAHLMSVGHDKTCAALYCTEPKCRGLKCLHPRPHCTCSHAPGPAPRGTEQQLCECGRPEKSWIHGDGTDQHRFRIPVIRERKLGSCVYCGIEQDNGLACPNNPTGFAMLHQMEKLR